MRPILIRHGRVLLPEGLSEADVMIVDGRIVEIGTPKPDGALVVDATGLMVAPALLDIHGDAFERQVMPRPGVFFPTDVALIDTDRQLAANGIATAYHALTLSWEPGLRSVDRGAAMIDAIDASAPRLAAEHRVQLRWETFATEALPLIERALAGPRTPSLAFNDHTSMTMRSFDLPVQERPFEQRADFPTADLSDPRIVRRIARDASRSGLSEDDYLSLLGEVWSRRPEVDANIRHLAEKGAEAGAPMLSHDDTQTETRTYYRGVGSRIAEFPMREDVAREARSSGDAVVFGAPNVVRGGSHIAGSPSAADMVESGLCTVLASDYYYPSMLSAVRRMDQERRRPLPELWATVSASPARASGLDDRGEIAIGQRGDVVLVDWPDEGVPSVEATLVAGRIAHLTGNRVH